MMNLRSTVLASAVFVGLGFTVAASAQTKELNIYNWSDYIAEDTLANFTKATGIKVTYDVFDSNEVLESKLLAGSTGYDLVFPTALPFAKRHVQAGMYAKVDKSKLPNLKNLDAGIMASLASFDPQNAHLTPYLWGTTGIGYNVEKVTKILGDDMPRDTWRLLFDPEIVAKLGSCGVSIMDDPTEVFAAVKAYLGKDNADFSSDTVNLMAETIAKVRPNIRYFHNSSYINDLANGDLCVAHGYSGDMLQARDRANEANNGNTIAYAVPREGAVVWTDVMAIPADAKNVVEALTFINYILEPKVIADISNYVAYANPNSAADTLVDDSIKSDPGIYPPAETRAKLLVLEVPQGGQVRTLNRAWTRVKSGK